MKKQTTKSPAFQFYAKDWLSDLRVKSLSYEEKGVYIELLAMSWLEPLPDDTELLCQALHIAQPLIEKILHTFFIKEGNFFYNKKLEEYREEKIKFIKSKKEAGRKGASSRWAKAKKQSIAQPLHSHNTAIDLPMANDSSSTDTSTSSSTESLNILSKDNTDESEPIDSEIINNSLEVQKEKEKSSAKKEKESYGNEDINRMLGTIKELLHLSDFKETQKLQRQYGLHLVNLKNKLGKEEFGSRFMQLAQDEFHLKNMGSLKYIYNQIKGFVPIKKDKSIPEIGIDPTKT